MIIEIELNDYEFLDTDVTEKVGTLKMHIDANKDELETVCEKLKLDQNTSTINITEDNNDEEKSDEIGLTKREQMDKNIINFIKQNNEVTVLNMLKVFNVSRNNLNIHLKRLKDEGRVELIGHGPTSKWKIVN